jgi:hypothetical protein
LLQHRVHIDGTDHWVDKRADDPAHAPGTMGGSHPLMIFPPRRPGRTSAGAAGAHAWLTGRRA